MIMMNNEMLDPIYRQQLARKLSHEGRFRVVIGNYPECPEAFEFITQPNDNATRVRYVNMDARSDAKLSILTQWSV